MECVPTCGSGVQFDKQLDGYLVLPACPSCMLPCSSARTCQPDDAANRPAGGLDWRSDDDQPGGPAGTTPSCCTNNSMSATPQCPQTRPAPSNRMLSINCPSARVAAGGTPMNSPLCVPLTLTRPPH